MAIQIKETITTLPSGECECMCQGCSERAKYRAPKSPELPGVYHYFCLQHVREYNRQWDFFSGKSSLEIDRFRKDSLSGHRKTKPAGVKQPGHQQERHVEDELARMFSRVNLRKERLKQSTPQLSTEHKQALTLLNVEHGASWKMIKASYKTLAKSHHPDINNASDGEMLKCINQAYSLLKTIYQTV
jgi:hypothetical protein